MENVSVITGFTQQLAALVIQFPVLQQMADIAIKSIVLLAIFWLVDICIGRKLNDTSRHLLWLYGLMCLALLPFTPAVFLVWQMLSTESADHQAQNAIFELRVYATQPTGQWTINWGLVAVAVYLAPVMLLLGRLGIAMRSLGQLDRQSAAPVNSNIQTRLVALRGQLHISRAITLTISSRIESPISYGLFRPQIVLPVQAREWSESTMTDVLLHELCHIRRLDWLTTLLAYVLASLFWINPLVWLALSRLRAESENSCDTAVLHAGRADTDYAESLLGVASSCIRARRHRHICPQNNRTNRNSNPLVQTMLDQNTLKTRISRVLEENKMNAIELKKEVKKSVAGLLLMSTAVLGILGSHQLLYAQPQPQPDPASRTVDEEMVPLNTIEPVYPRAAADASIEGWAQVSFTVSADGTVPESSVSIVDAEPADIFNNSAIAAARQFRFSPRIVAGEPVDVPNVQYVFRFYMSEESERAAQQQQ